MFVTAFANSTPASSVLLGDVNGDNLENIVDALMVAQYIVGLPVTINTSAADVNRDQSINIVDALLMAQFSVGIISHFQSILINCA